MERFIVSARKYRPGSFETLIGQENIAKTLKNSILRNQLAHAYLFCGSRGVGKTTSARIFAKTINCLSPSQEMDPCGLGHGGAHGDLCPPWPGGMGIGFAVSVPDPPGLGEAAASVLDGVGSGCCASRA